MKRTTWFVTLTALLLGCCGLAAAQCAGVSSPGGYDLLSTFSGSQDDLSHLNLGTVTFTGVPLPGGVAGNADTVICRKEALGNPGPNGTLLDIQIVALYLKGDTVYSPPGQASQSVTVYATINQTQNAAGVYKIPNDYNHLPQPDTLDASTGQMTVYSGGRFDTNKLSVEVDLIVVPQGDAINSPNRLFTAKSSDTPDSISSSGSTWTTSAPAGYPNSSLFPAGGFYVNDPSGGGGGMAMLITSRIVRGSLYVLGFFLVAIAILKIRSGVRGGQLSLKPVYLMGLAAMAWFLAWRASKLTFPTIAHAAAITTCVPHTISAWVNEGGGNFVVHKIVTAVCTTISTATSTNVLQQ